MDDRKNGKMYKGDKILNCVLDDLDIQLKEKDKFIIRDFRIRSYLNKRPSLISFLNCIPKILSRYMENIKLELDLLEYGKYLGVTVISDLNLSIDVANTLISNLLEDETDDTIYYSYRCTQPISAVVARDSLFNNSDYGHLPFKRRGKFILGDAVYLKHSKKNRDRRMSYLSSQGVIVKAYAVAKPYYKSRNTYYRVAFRGGGILSVAAAEIIHAGPIKDEY